jgi:hypothetical protein
MAIAEILIIGEKIEVTKGFTSWSLSPYTNRTR